MKNYYKHLKMFMKMKDYHILFQNIRMLNYFIFLKFHLE